MDNNIRRPAYGVDGFPVVPHYREYLFRLCAGLLRQIGLPNHLLDHFDFSSQESAQRSLNLCLATLDEAHHLIAHTQSTTTKDSQPF